MPFSCRKRIDSVFARLNLYLLLAQVRMCNAILLSSCKSMYSINVYQGQFDNLNRILKA